MKKFLICILQHRNVYFSVTAFLHLHAALKNRPDLSDSVKIIFACTGRKLVALESIQREYKGYDIDIFECEGDYLKKVNAVFSAYSVDQYEYFVKHDEDIFISPESWIRLLESADRCLSNQNNLLLSVNLSTGIPTWSHFSKLFFNLKQQNLILANLALSRLPDKLWGNDYGSINYQLNKNDCWDENQYWSLINNLGYDYRGIHPIRLEAWYPQYINELIISQYQNFLDAPVSGDIYQLNDRYFCNSFFCIRYSEYQAILADKSLFVDLFDEVPINRYALINSKNFCFLQDSLAVHIIYNSVYDQQVLIGDQFCSGRKLEQYFLRKYFELICLQLGVDSRSFGPRQSWLFWFERVRLKLKKALYQMALKIYSKHYWPGI